MDGWSVWPQFKIIRSITRNYNTIWQTIQKTRRKYNNIPYTPRMLGYVHKINKITNKCKETNLKNLSNHVQESKQYQPCPQRYSAGSSAKILPNELHGNKNVSNIKRSRRSFKYSSVFCMNDAQKCELKNTKSILEVKPLKEIGSLIPYGPSDIKLYNNYTQKAQTDNVFSRRFFSSHASEYDRDFDNNKASKEKPKNFWKTAEKKSSSALKYKKKEYHARIRSMESTKKQKPPPQEPHRSPTPKPYYSDVIKKNLKDMNRNKRVDIIPEPARLKKTVYDYTMFSKPEKVIKVISNAEVQDFKNDTERVLQKQTVSYNKGATRMREFIYPKKYLEKTRKIDVKKPTRPEKQASTYPRKPSYLETSVYQQQLKKKLRKKEAHETVIEKQNTQYKRNLHMPEKEAINEKKTRKREWDHDDDIATSKHDLKLHVFNNKPRKAIKDYKGKNVTPDQIPANEERRLETLKSDYNIQKKKDFKVPLNVFNSVKSLLPYRTSQSLQSEKESINVKNIVGVVKNTIRRTAEAGARKDKNSYLNYILQKHKQKQSVKQSPKSEEKSGSKYSEELKFNTMRSYLEKDKMSKLKAQKTNSVKSFNNKSFYKKPTVEPSEAEESAREVYFHRKDPWATDHHRWMTAISPQRNILPKIRDDWVDDISVKESLYTSKPVTVKQSQSSQFIKDDAYFRSDLEALVPRVHGQWKETPDPFEYQSKLHIRDKTAQLVKGNQPNPEKPKPFVSRSLPINFLAENLKLNTQKKRREKAHYRDLHNLCKIFPPSPSYSEKYRK